MNDFIRREDAIDAATQDSTENRTHSFRAGQARSASRIKALKPADVAPVVHGRWKYRGVCGIKDNITIRRYKCSECREDIVCDCPYNFCPHCGADMREVDE